jgi:hypothetical protein
MGSSLFRSTSIEDHLKFEQSRWRYYEEKIHLYDYFDLHFPGFSDLHCPVSVSEERKVSLIEDELRKRFLWKDGKPFQYIGSVTELSI